MKLESDLAQVDRQMGKNIVVSYFSLVCLLTYGVSLVFYVGVTKNDRALRDQNDAMREEIATLTQSVATLKDRNRVLAEALDKKKKELVAAKRHPTSTGMKRPLSAPTKPEVEIVAGPNPRSSGPVPAPPVNADGNWFATAQQLKAR